MAVKVAINGFGRIGRLAFRQMFGHEGSEIVAINDLTSPDMLAYLLKYDSTQGNYSRDHKVEATEDAIIVDGKEIKIYKEADANNLPWGDLDVDVVLECTGFYTSKAKAQAHINAGAKKVVISAPAGNDLPTIVYNVNHEELTAEDDIISAASCTTNCLAPMAKGLNDFAPIVSGIMTTIHAWTGDQMALDGPQRKGDKRRSRACAVNIVPNSTGAAKAIGLVLPELNGKLIGAAQRVPTPTGSLTNLYAVVDKGVTDANNMGAAMAPAAYDTLCALFRDTRTKPEDYDLIVTGDLGRLGHQIVSDFFARDGLPLGEHYTDCGLLLYDIESQDMHCGGSGCGCSASVLCGYLLRGMREGKWNRIIFAPTGALLSPTTTFQGESIPGICHAVVFSNHKEG